MALSCLRYCFTRALRFSLWVMSLLQPLVEGWSSKVSLPLRDMLKLLLLSCIPLLRDPYVESLTKHSSILINLPFNNKHVVEIDTERQLPH